MLKKVFSFILALSMIFSVGGMTATFAEEATVSGPHTLLSIDASKYFKEGTNVRNGYGFLGQSEIVIDDLAYGDTTRKALKVLTTNTTNASILNVSPLRNTAEDGKWNPNKKYIFRFDYFAPDDFLKPTAAGDKQTNHLFFNPEAELKKSIEVTSADGAIPLPSDYRYYSYYLKKDSSADFYSNGVPYPKYDTTAGNGKYTTYSAGTQGNDFRLNLEQWDNYEMLITKADEDNLYIAPYLHTAYGNMTAGFYYYIDDAYVQELVADEISVTKDAEAISELSVNQAATVSLGAVVKNQFGTELGFKDKNGTVMEPLKFTVTDKNGAVVSTNEFSLEEQTHTEPIYITTAKNTVTPVFTNETTTEWTTPTYDFNLVVTGKAPVGEYIVKAELQNKDIYGADKKAYEFVLNVTETENILANSGFETGISNMTGGAGTRTWETTVEKGDGTTVTPYEGNYAFKLEKTKATGYATTTDISVVPNTVYIAKEMLFKKSGTGNTGGNTYANLDSVKDAAGEKITVTTYESVTNFKTTDTWQQHELVFNTDAAVRLRLGLNSIGANTVVYADDFYIAPLRMKGTITGSDTIVKNISDTYTVDVTNQLGTTVGLSGAYAPVSTLSLKENYTGVTLENNVLIVTDEANVDEIVLVLNASTTLPIAPITVEKTVKITDNYMKNSGFETGISNMTGGAGTRTWETTVEKGDGTTVTPYEGNYAFKLEKTKATGYATTTDISVVPNTVYIAKEMLFKKSGTGNTGGNTYANLDSVKDAAGEKATVTTYESVTNFKTTDTWQQHELVFNTDSAVKLRLGLGSVGADTVVYADDFYLSPLRMVGTISGAEKVVLGETATYCADITNQLGTKTGASDDYVTVSYSLKEAVAGVAIDAQTGALTVEKTAEAADVIVVANAVHSLPGVKAITLEKTVELTPFALSISDFEVVENEENVSVAANLNGSASVAVVYAMYQGNQLIACNYVPVTAEDTVPLSYSFGKPDGSYTVKILILDIADSVTPLAYSKCSDQ